MTEFKFVFETVSRSYMRILTFTQQKYGQKRASSDIFSLHTVNARLLNAEFDKFIWVSCSTLENSIILLGF